MLKTMILLALIIPMNLMACILPINSRWLETSSSTNLLMLDVPNDRNLYLSYYNTEKKVSIPLAHYIYICDEKNLLIWSPDQEVVPFAKLEQMDLYNLTVHFTDRWGKPIYSINFKQQF